MFGSFSYGSQVYGGLSGGAGHYGLAISDLVGISEQLGTTLHLGDVILVDVISLAEGLNLALPIGVSLFDTISLGEGAITGTALVLFAQDTVSITEDFGVENFAQVYKFDSIGVEESLDRTNHIELAPFEIISIEEGTYFASALEFFTEDLIAVADAFGVEKISLVSAFEILQTIESLYLEVFVNINTEEDLFVFEDISFFIPLSLEALDLVGVLDNVNAAHVLDASVSDNVGIILETLFLETIRYSPGVISSKQIGWSPRNSRYAIGGTSVSW